MRSLVAILLLAGACSPGPSRDPLDAYFAELRASSEDDLRGVIVVVDGTVVREEYFHGARRDDLHDIRSAGKSITSLLVGIAIDRGLIAGTDEPLGRLLVLDPGEPLAAVRLDDVLTMRTGLAADDADPASPGSEDRMDEAPDWLAFVRGVPAGSPPGRSYVYASVNAFLAGAIVERASGLALADFADLHLFAPLGIDAHAWRRGPRGEGAGQGNLRLRLRDLATIGGMVLDRGTHRGARIVSASWIDASLAPRVAIDTVDPYADHYGYMWYRKTHRVGDEDILVHFASGNGGNKIYIVPSRRMVVAITSSAYGSSYGQRRSEKILLEVLGRLR